MLVFVPYMYWEIGCIRQIDSPEYNCPKSTRDEECAICNVDPPSAEQLPAQRVQLFWPLVFLTSRILSVLAIGTGTSTAVATDCTVYRTRPYDESYCMNDGIMMGTTTRE